jgi:hypothetical protein
MAGLHVKQPMFYPRDWDLAFYGILQMHCVHFTQSMFYILEWGGFGGIPYFIKMDSLHVKQLMCHRLNWEWYNTTACNEVAPMFKGCKTAAVVEQYYAQAVCSRNGWDAGLITHMHWSEDLVNPLS